MNFQEVKTILKLDSTFDVFAEGFELSMQSFENQKPSFLNPDNVEANCKRIGISNDITDAIVSAAHELPENKCIWAIAWHCHRLLYCQEEIPIFKYWPMRDWYFKIILSRNQSSPLDTSECY